MLCNQDKFLRLREEFPCFVYEGFEYEIIESGDFVVEFRFRCGENFFSPRHIFASNEDLDFSAVEKGCLESLIFNLGMIESLSYWKAFCSPCFKVKDWRLNTKQVEFWRKIYYYGLGEFFFVNGISTDINSFIEFEFEGKRALNVSHLDLYDGYIVPVGGGKDSVVTLDLLYGAGKDIRPFILNPRGASRDCCLKAGFSEAECLVDRRNIDKNLLDLNASGFLNGHTPFSAMLAFSSLLMSAFSKRRNIALSNEASADESTVLGEKINHQYSKSFEFENDFRSYVAEFISSDFNYFSFLRPFSELMIAKCFSFLDYKEVFKSCNAGSKEDIWCCNCPKCLFAFIILSPFVSKEALSKAFGKNLFAEKGLSEFLFQLCGLEKQKPFECVGTVCEVNWAIAMRLFNQRAADDEVLLHEWSTFPLSKSYSEAVETMYEEGKSNILFSLSGESNLSEEERDILSKPYLYAKMAELRRRLRNEKVAILGFGREGRSSSDLLRRLSLCKDVVVADGNEVLMRECEASKPENSGLSFRKLDCEAVKGRSLILKTPGIACKRLPYVEKEKISSQTELFLALFNRQIIGISGTKGKSTTASLIYNMVKAQRENVILAGNIGIPFFDTLASIDENSIIVAELSAHQLQFIDKSPHISVLLNLYEEHLDHFDGFSDYENAKFNLANKQSDEDFFVYNAEDKEISRLIMENKPKSRLIPFRKEDYVYAEPEFLKGEHNKANAMAALSVAKILALDMEKAVESVLGFETLAHRMQFVGEKEGVLYYDDSISTVPQATLAALKALNRVDTLILGGMDRGIDYSVLVKELPEYGLRNIAFTGKAGRRMASLMENAALQYNCIIEDDYENIVSWCRKVTKPGTICLLSPAASSYDRFKNFEERGRLFRELVLKD